MEPHAPRLGCTTSRVTSDVEGDQSSIRIEGVLDALTIGYLSPVFDAVVSDGSRRVTVDCEQMTLLDSRGVSAIVSLAKRVSAQGGQVVVVHAHDQPLAVLKLLKLDAILGV